MNTDGFPSGQRERTVNPLSQTTMVRIHPRPPNMRAWRNWQTRTVQVRMGATPWRFKSSCPHQQQRHPLRCLCCWYEKAARTSIENAVRFLNAGDVKPNLQQITCLRQWRVQVLLPAPQLIELLSTRRKFFFLAFSGANQRKISQNTNKSGSGTPPEPSSFPLSAAKHLKTPRKVGVLFAY